MKPIFCTDITTNKYNQEINGKEFIIANADEELRQEVDKRASELEATIQNAKLPSIVVTLRSIAGFLALFMAFSVFKIISEGSLSAIFAGSNLTATVTCLGAAAVWAYLTHIGKEREKSLNDNPEIKGKSQRLENGINTLFTAMGVPENAASADLLMFQYKVKDGEICPVSLPLMPEAYINLDCKVYDGGDSLCIADVENVFSFKKEDIKGIRYIEKKICIASWNKAAAPTAPQFAEYSLSIGRMGAIAMPGYYVVDLVHNGEDMVIYFPPYELSVFEKIINNKENFISSEGDTECGDSESDSLETTSQVDITDTEASAEIESSEDESTEDDSIESEDCDTESDEQKITEDMLPTDEEDCDLEEENLE